MNWEKTTIGEHCTVTSSKRFHLSERSTSGVPFYCSKEIIQKVNGHEIIECDYIREELYEQVKKTIWSSKDRRLTDYNQRNLWCSIHLQCHRPILFCRW